jgi:hypothetical protein
MKRTKRYIDGYLRKYPEDADVLLLSVAVHLNLGNMRRARTHLRKLIQFPEFISHIDTMYTLISVISRVDIPEKKEVVEIVNNLLAKEFPDGVPSDNKLLALLKEDSDS